MIAAKSPSVPVKPPPFPQTPAPATPVEASRASSAKTVSLQAEVTDNAVRKLPAYADYYQHVRNKIRQTAYAAYDGAIHGEVALIFVVKNDGNLESLSVKDNPAGTSLTALAVDSIQKAAPFSRFPAALQNYARLQFSITIYFKND